ncbi:hypothetical protein J7K19_08355, partial [bacterium]|nr:hypothetical protein [bacterium]
MRRKWLPFIIAAVTLIGLTYFLNNPSYPEIVKAGSSDNVFGWAWSKNIGWISFNCTNTVCWDPNTQELLDYSCLNNSCTNNGGECRSSCEGAWGPNLAKTPEVVWLGASLVYTGGDYIYATMGGARKDFYRYSISNDSWHPLASTTEVVNAGNLVYDGGDYIYSIFWSGANLYRYSISSDEWTFVTTFPGASGLGYNEYGLSLAYVNGYIYVNCSRAGGRCFYRYYISSDSWEQLADAPADFGEGAYIVYTGGDYIYALRGGKTTDFWRYSISNNKWEPLSSVPSKVRYDGCLVYTGGDYIYATVGDSSGGVFYRYSISNDSWESQPSTPEWYAWGSRMTYAKGYIYMFEGNTPTNPKGFWRFRIPVDYGVNIDGTTGKFSGYAWAENIGWIDFAPPGSYPSSPNFSARVDLDGTTCGQIGNICGWARAVSASSSPTEAGGWGGWIKLSGTSTDGTHYGVSLNPATKEFEGWAAGWDDDSTSTAVIGWISFNCKNESWCATSSYQVKVKAAL